MSTGTAIGCYSWQLWQPRLQAATWCLTSPGHPQWPTRNSCAIESWYRSCFNLTGTLQGPNNNKIFWSKWIHPHSTSTDHYFASSLSKPPWSGEEPPTIGGLCLSTQFPRAEIFIFMKIAERSTKQHIQTPLAGFNVSLVFPVTASILEITLPTQKLCSSVRYFYIFFQIFLFILSSYPFA